MAIGDKRLHVFPLHPPPTTTPLQYQQSAPALNSSSGSSVHSDRRGSAERRSLAGSHHKRSTSMDQHSSAPHHQRSTSMESSHSASEVRRLHVLPMDSGQSAQSATPTQSSSSLNNSLDESIQSGWSLDRIQRSMEQKATSFDNMLAPLQENPEDTSPHSHMTSGQLAPPHIIPVNPPSFPRQQVPTRLPKVAKKPLKVKTAKPPGLGHAPEPEVVPKSHHRYPKTTSPPPDIVPNSNGHHIYSSDEEDPNSIAINKKRPKVPDLTTIDPRKPKLKVKKVPRSVWQPRPMTRAIQSSSSDSDSDGSDYSVDTVIVGGEPGDSSTLKSAHV